MDSQVRVVNVRRDEPVQLTFDIFRCPVCLRRFFLLPIGALPFVNCEPWDIGAIVAREALCQVNVQPEVERQEEHVS